MTALGEKWLRRLGGEEFSKIVTGPEMRAALNGEYQAETRPINGITPWSARIRTDHSASLLKLLGVILGLFFLWAVIFQVDKVTRGSGRVIPSVQNQVVQHLEGGIVKAILVTEGQRVHKGDILMVIDNRFTAAELNNASTDVVAKRISLARMEAEVRGLSTFVVPPELAKLAPDIAASEEALFLSHRQQEGEDISIVDEQIRARQVEIQSNQARLANLRNEERLLMEQLDKLERAYEAEAISEREVLDKRSALLQLRTRIADAEHSIPQARAELQEARARRGQLLAKSESETYEHAADLRVDLNKAYQELGAYRDRQSRTEIRAPMDGVVNKLYVQTVGGVIKGGDPLAEIVPVDKVVIVEARVQPKDRGNIWPGLPAKIKITAYDSAIHGGLDGKVVDVSPDVLQDARGEVYYRVRLRTDSAKFGADKPVMPGMTAEVDITSGHESIMSYLLGPLIRIGDSALTEH